MILSLSNPAQGNANLTRAIKFLNNIDSINDKKEEKKAKKINDYNTNLEDYINKYKK